MEFYRIYLFCTCHLLLSKIPRNCYYQRSLAVFFLNLLCVLHAPADGHQECSGWPWYERFAVKILVQGGHVYSLILDMNLGVGCLGRRFGICVALVDKAKLFFKVITPRMGA